MRLTETAIQTIDKPATRLKLALALGFTEAWIISLLSKNKSNSPLTTATALKIIEDETGLKQKQILEPEVVTAKSGQ